MSKYETISERRRMENLGWDPARIDATIAMTFRHPTIKRLEGIHADSPEVSEVGSALSELIGVILEEGFTLYDATGSFRDGILYSWDIMFMRETEIRFEYDWIRLDVGAGIVEAFMDCPEQTYLKVQISRSNDNIRRRSSVEVDYPSRLDAIDRYDTIVDTIVPGIERLKRFSVGFIDA
jgi:hypothetical protein